KLSRDKWDSINSWSYIGEILSYKFNNKTLKIDKYDFKSAVKFYKKAYELGSDPKTAYEIGLLYKEGDKTLTKNNSKAFEWFYKSAVQNYMPAQLEVGYMYSHGLGVEENQKSAIKWLKKAHNHNLFACSICYKTEIMLNNLGFVNFFRNIKQIYEF
ncbi:MAG: tetratricopeptide repeat protein, partial [Oligoflexia bacterium]|nr:tetratricopeptide repeat protein [Oligoflexia bacterium]